MTKTKLQEEVQMALSKVISVLKKQLAVIIAEVVAKSFLDHMYYEAESKRTNGQSHLSTSARTRAIAKTATNSINRCCFLEQDQSVVNMEEVSQEVNERLKSSFNQNLNAGPSSASK